ncbi:SnoaL-like domain-containing protein [Spirosoma taeanense]|uniref:SnoaL-like domain-containing protein n=1 Tax=Spirosoma taeanense TaxID=2735870 RepID=A0A6M5YCA4_9BACT|nr:nuclear transport factor 2 family protein [Spirosoma taeanense]QJW90542.1 SnoaL-like domain-containing protein [Spirosoma taeanense]
MKTNQEIVQAIYEAFGQGNIPAILDHLADDVQWESWADNSAQQQNVPWLKARQGKEAVPEFFSIVGQLNLTDFQVLSIMAGGNQVAAEIIVETASSALATSFRDEEMHLWTFNDEGKVTRLRHYTDTFKHIQAAKAATTVPA